MTQSGIFRTSMRGFNKQDVLQYVEEFSARTAAEQAAATEEIARQQQLVSELRAQLEDANAKLTAAEENADQLQQLVNEYRQTVQQMNRFEEQVDALNREKMELNTQRVQAEKQSNEHKTRLEQVLAENEELKEKLTTQFVSEEERRRIAKIEADCQRVVAENRRYRALIGHVGTFVAEVRQMNQGILDAGYDRETEILDAADEKLAYLVSQLESGRRELQDFKTLVAERRHASDMRLDVMMRQLEQNAQPEFFSESDA